MTAAAPPPSHRRRATQPSAPPETETDELAGLVAAVPRGDGPRRSPVRQPDPDAPIRGGADLAGPDERADVVPALGQVSRAGTTRWTDQQRADNGLDSAAARSLDLPPPVVDLGASSDALDLDALLRRVPRG